MSEEYFQRYTHVAKDIHPAHMYPQDDPRYSGQVAMLIFTIDGQDYKVPGDSDWIRQRNIDPIGALISIETRTQFPGVPPLPRAE